MKIFKRMEFDMIDFKEVYKEGCFKDKDLGLEFRIIKDSWEEVDGGWVRYIEQAELISASVIQHDNSQPCNDTSP